MLRDKSSSDDWRQRDLARALILRIEQPKKTRSWEVLLWSWGQTFKSRDDGTVLVTFPGQIIPRLPPEIPQDEDVVVTKECVPYLLDTMREIAPQMGNRDFQWAHCLKLLEHFADQESSHALAYHLRYVYRRDDPLKDILVELGTDAVPALRDVVRAAPPPVNAELKLTQQERTERYRATQASANAAELLAQLGDRKSVPLLVEVAIRFLNHENAATTRLAQPQTAKSDDELVRPGWQGDSISCAIERVCEDSLLAQQLYLRLSTLLPRLSTSD